MWSKRARAVRVLCGCFFVMDGSFFSSLCMLFPRDLPRGYIFFVFENWFGLGGGTWTGAPCKQVNPPQHTLGVAWAAAAHAAAVPSNHARQEASWVLRRG